MPWQSGTQAKSVGPNILEQPIMYALVVGEMGSSPPDLINWSDTITFAVPNLFTRSARESSEM